MSEIVPIGSIKLHCPNCSGSVMELPDNPAESDRIICNACRHDLCSVGEYREMIRRKAIANRENIINAVKGVIKP